MPDLLIDLQNLDNLFTKKKDLHFGYLQTVTEFSYGERIVLTSKVTELTECWKKETKTSIEGPKGCGKTVLCATLYQLLARKETFDHIFLSFKLLDFARPVCCQYFNMLYQEQRELFAEDLTIGKNPSTDCQNAIQILSVVSSYRPLRVFIDLSMFTDLDIKNNKAFLDIMQELHLQKHNEILISISSGMRHLTNFPRLAAVPIKNILNNYHAFHVTGFTVEEARNYCSKFSSYF